MQASRNNVDPTQFQPYPQKHRSLKFTKYQLLLLKDVSSLPCVRLIKYIRHVNKLKIFL